MTGNMTWSVKVSHYNCGECTHFALKDILGRHALLSVGITSMNIQLMFVYYIIISTWHIHPFF